MWQNSNQEYNSNQEIAILLAYLTLENELVFKFYLAQKFKPGRNDWILSVYKDMEELGITMNEDEIKKISLIKFKEILLSKIKTFVNSDVGLRQIVLSL